MHVGFFPGARAIRARRLAVARDVAGLAGLLFTAAVAAIVALAEMGIAP